MEKDPKQLKVRYSIETYEQLLVNQEEMRKSFEEMRKSNEEVRKSNEEIRKIVMMPKEDRMNEDSRGKVA